MSSLLDDNEDIFVTCTSEATPSDPPLLSLGSYHQARSPSVGQIFVLINLLPTAVSNALISQPETESIYGHSHGTDTALRESDLLETGNY